MSLRRLLRGLKQSLKSLSLVFITMLFMAWVFIRFCCNESINGPYVLRGMTFEGSNMETRPNTTESNITTAVERDLTCPETPPSLRGRLDIVDLHHTSLNLSLSTNYGGEVERGGIWRPKNCKARKKVAFMIPFRNRWEQLNTFLNHMHPVFQSQQLDYRIFVVEQVIYHFNNKF